MSEEFKSENPDYTSLKRVRLDIKRVSKGRLWNQTAQALSSARAEIRREDAERSEARPRKVRHAEALARAKKLAEAIIDAFESGEMMSALSDAGVRMQQNEDVYQEYLCAFDAHEKDPWDEGKEAECNRLETAAHAASDYLTMNGKGEEQAEYLKALDFIDSPVPSIRLFNVCRAKAGWNVASGCFGACGLAFPSKRWRRPI